MFRKYDLFLVFEHVVKKWGHNEEQNTLYHTKAEIVDLKIYLTCWRPISLAQHIHIIIIRFLVISFILYVYVPLFQFSFLASGTNYLKCTVFQALPKYKWTSSIVRGETYFPDIVRIRYYINIYFLNSFTEKLVNLPSINKHYTKYTTEAVYPFNFFSYYLKSI